MCEDFSLQTDEHSKMNNSELIPFEPLIAYCFEGNHLHCGHTKEVKSLYLPLGDVNSNYSLSIVVTVKNEHDRANTTILTQVCVLPLPVCR